MKIKLADNLHFPDTCKSESCSDELFNNFNDHKVVEINSFDDLITMPENFGQMIYVVDLL